MKMRFFAVIFSILMIITMTSCTADENNTDVRTMYYVNVDYFYEYDPASMTPASIPQSDQIELNDEQRKLCDETIAKIKKKHPDITTGCTIKAVRTSYFERNPSFYSYAFYNPKDKMIFVREDFSKEDVSYFCHEYFHFLSDYGKDMIGLQHLYKSNGKNYILGYDLNEGLANYFSTQIEKHPNGTSIYELETHLVSLIATAYGEEKLYEAFTTGNYEDLKKDFNSKMSAHYPNDGENFRDATIFDLFLSSIELYKGILEKDAYFAQEGRADEWISSFAMLADSLEETAYNYCVTSNKRTEARNLIRSFLQNENLHLRECAHFPDIINN